VLDPLQVRPTRAEIDLDALAHNLRMARQAAGGAEVLAVVKADAYGHGLLPVARRLADERVDGLGVALVEEGLALREAGLKVPILVLNGIYDGAHAHVLEAGLAPCVYDFADVERFANAARGASFGIHLKVDTGMSRLGVPDREIDHFLDRCARVPNLRLDGLMTHLSSAEHDPETTEAQLERFAIARRSVLARGHRPRVHAANSAATLLCPNARFDLVRPGLILYGGRPRRDVGLELRPVMRVVASVARVTTIAAGEAVGYSRAWTASKESRIATLAIGYGDGLMRHLSNRGEVLIRGTRCPIVGLVSMDLTGVDVSALETCERGDDAVILGAQGDERLTAEEVAERAGTVGYEVLTSLLPRVPRVYLDGDAARE
jgi:alanine racemase